jgi:hypothetical protein
MKSTIVTILQQRMDKCTHEQFWVTGAITGLNAFLLSQASTIRTLFSNEAILSVSMVICIYGVFFVVSRHVWYYTIREAMSKILRSEDDIPDFIIKKVNPWTGQSLVGVTFYSGLILAGEIGVIITYF